MARRDAATTLGAMDGMNRNERLADEQRTALHLLRSAFAIVVALALVSSVADGAFTENWSPVVAGLVGLAVSAYVVLSSARQTAEPFETELARLLDENPV